RGSVSGTSSADPANIVTARPARTTSTPRQPMWSTSALPSSGATTGATPAISINKVKARAAACPVDRSAITARPNTIPAAALSPCSSRAASSTPSVGATAAPMLARTNTAVPTSSGRRRPTRSESGPNTSCPPAIPSRNIVSVSWMVVSEPSRSARISGKAARYRSLPKGATLASSASTNSSGRPTAERDAPAMRPNLLADSPLHPSAEGNLRYVSIAGTRTQRCARRDGEAAAEWRRRPHPRRTPWPWYRQRPTTLWLMQSRGRFAGVAVGALLAAVALGGCSLIGLGDEEPLTCQGEAPPSSAPGDSQVLMTVGQGETSWDITTVVYADGSVALIDDGADSAAGAGPTWHTGYLLPCALDEARSLAEEALFGAPDFGEVVLSDGSWTWVHYDNGALSALAKVYGFESGYTEGLDWSQRRAREDLEALTDFLSVNIVSTGERLPIGAVQVDTGAEAPAAEVGDEDSAGKDSGDGGSEDD